MWSVLTVVAAVAVMLVVAAVVVVVIVMEALLARVHFTQWATLLTPLLWARTGVWPMTSGRRHLSGCSLNVRIFFAVFVLS
jgi:hypothetical protein